ncbi:hypothetical protein GNX71_23585 [Variovorax sp. RKNM96]|uniref:hypothetical protein n=1 Tax=Variovorax sp. RKNM96 TaxID=2681552 RepID=UPI00197CDB95|nr:hypothetical protein [Variovorax sp. RKNM96]QSI32409.1 hypothetical protein GNX71_23585 [Variovorax sp. RKNM96]
MTPTQRRERRIRFAAMGFAKLSVAKAEGKYRAVRSAASPRVGASAFEPFVLHLAARRRRS